MASATPPARCDCATRESALAARVQDLEKANRELARYLNLGGDPDIITFHASKYLVIDTLKKFASKRSARSAGLPPGALYCTPSGHVRIV